MVTCLDITAGLLVLSAVWFLGRAAHYHKDLGAYDIMDLDSDTKRMVLSTAPSISSSWIDTGR